MYVYEPQQNLGQGLHIHKTSLSPPVIYYLPFQGGISVVVYESRVRVRVGCA